MTGPIRVANEASDLNDVQIFVAVADAQTLTAAARSLRVPASTISRAISRLEKRLQVTLAQRNARGFVLTDVGRGYLAACRKALRALNEGEDWIEAQRSQPNGTLKVACPITFAREILAPLTRSFLQRFPGLKLELQTYASGQDYSPADEIDILFKVRRPRDSARRMKSYPGHALGIFANVEYLKEHGKPTDLGDLTHHACIGCGPWKLSREQRSETVQPAFLVTTHDPHIHLSLVSTGVGIGTLPLWLAHRPDVRDQLEPVLPDWKLEPLVMCALYFGPLNQSPKVQAMLEFLGEYIGTPLDPRIRNNWSKDLFPSTAAFAES